MDPDFNYEPKMDESIAGRAAAAGVSPAEYAYDLLMKDDGKGFIYFPILNYRDGNLNFLEDLQAANDTVNSLSVRRRALRDDLRRGVADLHAPALGARPRRKARRARTCGEAAVPRHGLASMASRTAASSRRAISPIST